MVKSTDRVRAKFSKHRLGAGSEPLEYVARYFPESMRDIYACSPGVDCRPNTLQDLSDLAVSEMGSYLGPVPFPLVRYGVEDMQRIAFL